MRRRYKALGGAAIVVTVAVVAFAGYLAHEGECRTPDPLPAGAPRMRAVVYRCYGGPERARLEEVARPALADDRVLIKVRAAAVNPLDFHYLRGEPYVMRMSSGVGAPANPRLGVDFAGVVEAVGPNVRRFKAGDEVFGGVTGAFAEYVSMTESRALARKPANLSFEQAAAVPIAGVTALQALRDIGALRPGQRVLINGASGGVGTFAVQIAAAMGAEVAGVCSTRNVAMVRALGAGRVFDYTREDFTRASERYDLIVDTVGNHPLSALRRALTPGGRAVLVGGPNDGKWIGPLSIAIKATAYSPFVSQAFRFFIAEMNQKDLDVLRGLMQEGKVTPVIDRRYPLAELPAAIRYLEEGHARGKVIIDVAE
jgi:NADPH:quinone reductase-like Zn-dependent oxidoreductase